MYSTLVRGIEALEILGRAGEPLALAEIARRLKTSKSGTHGLLAALVRCGYANRMAGGVYSIGLKAWEIGRFVPTAQLVQVAAPVMSRLASTVNDGVILGVLSGFDVAYVHLVGSSQAVRVHAEVGQRIPAHCTSTGLALLAAQEVGYLDQVMPKRLQAVAPETITDPEKLRREIARVRARGYSINQGGWSAEVGGVAMAISCNPAYGPAGLCIAVPRYRMTSQWIRKGVAALAAATSEIEAALPQSSRLAA